LSHFRKLLAALASAALLAGLAVPAGAYAPVRDGMGRAQAGGTDNLPHPLAERQQQAKAEALQAVLSGKAKAKGKNKVVQQGKGQFVELAQVGEDLIWTVLGEFGDQIHPVTGGTAGPERNQIPQPDRKVDNSTIWTADFTKDYYENLLFSREAGAVSMANYYIEQSSGMYSVDGEVTDWVQVPFNSARYGTNLCGGIVCSTVWDFVNHSIDAWYADMIAAGWTDADVNAYLAKYDVWDRYDADGDGDFNEPDGYIDHFQSVHAGVGEETGGGAQGEDAIWSHRWFAWFNGLGPDGGGPSDFGGARIGTSNYWVGDYTIEPENGGVGVFAHEFAHDLGLPDLYDTAGNTGGGENSTGFWTLMSSGSYGNNGKEDIGSQPVHMGAFEKVLLGWLDYALADWTQSGSVKLGPSMHISKNAAQALIVLLPDKEKQTFIGGPFEGANFYYSGSGPDLDNLMYQEVTLPAAPVGLTAKVRYNIEEDWDYAYVVVSDDGGATWTGAETNLSTDDDPNGQNFGNGITGSSGGAWVDLTAELDDWAGETVLVGFRYWTDPFVNPVGFSVDNISIAGGPTMGAEADDGFTFDPADGFHVSDGNEISFHFNAYVAEFRQYRGYDRSLKTGPYNFGFLDDPDLGNYVEHFPYQEGLLISYWDETFEDNNTGANCDDGRCGGLILPVDAHPTPMVRGDGAYWRSRIQSYDSPFGTTPTKRIKVHINSIPSVHRSLPGTPIFDDSDPERYWNAAIPWSSVRVAGLGVTIEAGPVSGSTMTVYLNR